MMAEAAVDCALIVFLKNPVLGKVKTRLAKDIGDKKALEIYKELIEYTISLVGEIPFQKYLFYSDYINEPILKSEDFFQFVQKGNDLGNRMEDAFRKVFDLGFKKVVIIGSDSLEVKKDHILEAFDALDENEIVFGPAFDGGYYLLGMKDLHVKAFRNKKWSTLSLLEESLADLSEKKIHLLEKLSDIDFLKDVLKYKELRDYL